MSTTDAPPPAAPLGSALSADWLATILAVALAGLAWVGVLPHVAW